MGEMWLFGGCSKKGKVVRNQWRGLTRQQRSYGLCVYVCSVFLGGYRREPMRKSFEHRRMMEWSEVVRDGEGRSKNKKNVSRGSNCQTEPLDQLHCRGALLTAQRVGLDNKNFS